VSEHRDGVRLCALLFETGHRWEESAVLLKGLNHVAVITNDATRLQTFYAEVFDAEVLRDGPEFPDGEGPRLSIIKIGEWSELTFSDSRNTEA